MKDEKITFNDKNNKFPIILSIRCSEDNRKYISAAKNKNALIITESNHENATKLLKKIPRLNSASVNKRLTFRSSVCTSSSSSPSERVSFSLCCSVRLCTFGSERVQTPSTCCSSWRECKPQEQTLTSSVRRHCSTDSSTSSDRRRA